MTEPMADCPGTTSNDTLNQDIDRPWETLRYKVQQEVGRGSYGTVFSALDTLTGEQVAIKKVHNVFENVSDATRILRELKLLRLFKHPDIVGIKHILLPSNPLSFKDIFIVFELMDCDLHTVINANDDLNKVKLAWIHTYIFL